MLSVCVFFFLFFSFMLFFQAVSPQLPHADSSDIHFSFYPPFLPPSPAYPRRSRVSVWSRTLTSFYCFSSFSFKAQNLTSPTFPPFLITKLLASTSASPGLAPSCSILTSHCAHGGVCVFLVYSMILFVCSVLVVLSLSCRIVVVLCPSLPTPPSSSSSL